ncbi:hypothetical protein LXA43DRAFT_895610, partial [Ganoderma leucocontextum]
PVATPTPLHPLLCHDDSSGRSKLLFDLSSHTFSPRYSTRSDNGEIRSLLDELSTPATFPPVYRMTVTCDSLPQWSITIERRISTTCATFNKFPEVASWADAPITAYDVLAAIYRAFHDHVSSGEWGKLARDERQRVLDAYMCRCRRYAGTHWFHAVGGIRRVDCLRTRCMFGGLIGQSIQGGVAYMKLVVREKTAS